MDAATVEWLPRPSIANIPTFIFVCFGFKQPVNLDETGNNKPARLHFLACGSTSLLLASTMSMEALIF